MGKEYSRVQFCSNRIESVFQNIFIVLANNMAVFSLKKVISL